jgi:hypothetical protein
MFPKMSGNCTIFLSTLVSTILNYAQTQSRAIYHCVKIIEFKFTDIFFLINDLVNYVF